MPQSTQEIINSRKDILREATRVRRTECFLPDINLSLSPLKIFQTNPQTVTSRAII